MYFNIFICISIYRYSFIYKAHQWAISARNVFPMCFSHSQFSIEAFYTIILIFLRPELIITQPFPSHNALINSWRTFFFCFITRLAITSIHYTMMLIFSHVFAPIRNRSLCGGYTHLMMYAFPAHITRLVMDICNVCSSQPVTSKDKLNFIFYLPI